MSTPALPQTGNLLEMVVNACEAGLIVLDRHSRVVLWNDWIATASGVPPEQALGASIETVFPEGMPTRVAQAIRHSLQHGMAALLSQSLHKTPLPLYRTAAERQAGTRMQQMVFLKPLDLPGSDRHCLIQISDVTSTALREQLLRKQAQAMQDLAEECRQSERRMRAIVDSALDGIITIDEHGLIETYNPAAAHIFAYDTAAVIGQHVQHLIPDLPVGKAVLAGYGGAMRGQHASGKTLPLEVTVSAMHLGRRALAVAIVRDVTERTQVEADLIQAREAALEASRVKSTFLANMSHELRTPMNGVLGMLNLLRHTPLTPEQQQYVEMAHSSGDVLLTLLNDILDLSKIEAGRLVLEHIPFDVRLTVEDVADLFAERAYSKGLELACLISPEVPRSVCGDPTRLRQVLTNLVSNAIKFTDRGEVVIRVSLAAAQPQTPVLLFEVCDTGIGISPAVQERIFEAFTQADDSTTRKYGGTGLGLSISRHLVTSMGGTIQVTSLPAQGSTFSFTICVEASDVLTVPGMPSTDLVGKRILVVDNHPLNRLLLQRLLTSWNVQHNSSATAGEALRELCRASTAGQPYDLLLLNAYLPDMSGLQLAHALQAIPALTPLHVVLLTPLGQRGEGKAARAAGIQGYLSKPIRQSQLYECLLTVLGLRARASDTLVTRHTLKEVKAQQRKTLLLAEDNLVNQKVALGFLKQLGYRADVVANGREAVAALAQQPYDLVFMDCQMPELDGFAATAQIRQNEGAERHTLIVAMTANVMQGDRERCLQAGMDDYMPKPMTLEGLREQLTRWLPDDEATTESLPEVALATGEPGAASDPPVMPQALEVIREVLEEAFPETITAFLHDTTGHLAALHHAVLQRDTETLAYLAHTLKGSSSNLGAMRFAHLCQQLMDASQRLTLAEVAASLEQLDAEFLRVRALLEPLCHSVTNHAGVSRGT